MRFVKTLCLCGSGSKNPINEKVIIIPVQSKFYQPITMIRLLLFIFINALFLTACKNKTETALEGKWYASKLLECDAVIPIQNNLINLEFRPNRTYIFNSTLNTHEEGTYTLYNNYLILQDNIKAGSKSRTLLIKKIDADSLVIQMNNKGLDQYLTLMHDFKKALTVEDSSTLEKEVRVDTTDTKVSVKN